MGFFASLRPARERRIAWEMTLIASCWPMTRLWSASSMCTSFSVSDSVSEVTGTPVHLETTTATSSAAIVGMDWSRFSRHFFFMSSSCLRSSFSLSRKRAAFSYSWPLMAEDFSLTVFSISASLSLNWGGACDVCRRAREPASSMRSMALSGRKRSLM